MNDKIPYRQIPDYPDKIDAADVITRMIDGLGFRFYWATEDLTEKDYTFRITPQSMTIGEIIGHVWGLVNWIGLSLYGKHFNRPQIISDVRNSALENIMILRNDFLKMTEEELNNIRIDDRPFWNMINGPIADALTHVGQINVLRRAAGNPCLDSNLFTGSPPNP